MPPVWQDLFPQHHTKRAVQDEEFLLTEAFDFLIEKTHDTRWMVGLGGYFYGQKKFDLALKYYEMADSYGDRWAPEGLGYIWLITEWGDRTNAIIKGVDAMKD